MKKSMAKKVIAASIAAAMTMSVAACGEEPAASTSTPEASTSTEASVSESVEASTEGEGEEVSPYTVITDADGNPVDLGGFEMTIRDWWSGEWRDSEPATDYEEAVYAYREWVEETYNCTIHTAALGDWGSCANDFVDYVSAGGDDQNYVWTIWSGNPTFLEAAKTGLVYDLSTLDCLDFSDRKYADNGVHKLYSLNGGIFGMHTGASEPRTGVIFNRRVLTEAGVDPDSLYDMQAAGTWTWDAFEEVLSKVQQDTDNDGTIDIWGMALNEGVATKAAVLSNGGNYVGMVDGKYTYEIENPKTLEALEWILGIFQKYDWNGPVAEDGTAASWDYYQGQFQSGQAAFCIDQQYCFSPNNLFYDMEDELGFVMFPAGPQGSLVQSGEDNIYCIPGCYDADRAWKTAFCYDVFNELIPGYEDYNPYVNTTLTGNVDTRAAEETVPMMGANSVADYAGMIPNNGDFMNEPFTYRIGPDTDVTISEIIDGMRDIAKSYIDDANN